MGHELRIVDPESGAECPPHRVGEIWVAGPSVAPGYWHKPEQTAHDFGARLADAPAAGPFLRTGDLGFLWDGELFVTGRSKDLIIIRGRNHYPQDLELTAGQAHPALRPGGGAAFSVDVDAEEQLVVVLREWNDTGSDRRPACLHELVTSQARLSPRAVALVCGRSGRTLSYAQLERRSAALAAALRALGVGTEVRVGVCMPRTPELVVALLGVLRAGGTYVPIDPDYPVERQGFMLADSAARVLISDSGLAGRLPAGVRVLYLDELPRRAPAGATRGVRINPDNLSHLIYTSGSTGVPKGVAIRHAAAVAMVRWSLRRYRPEELYGVLLSTSICFDISVFEIFVPLACGGAVIVAENALELPALAVRGQVTLINTVPSAMTELVRHGAVPSAATRRCAPPSSRRPGNRRPGNRSR